MPFHYFNIAKRIIQRMKNLKQSYRIPYYMYIVVKTSEIRSCHCQCTVLHERRYSFRVARKYISLRIVMI